MKKKTIGLAIAVVIALGCAAGATIAWLTDSTTPVTNTFTKSTVDVELAETTGTDYQMVPGYTITKDPKVTLTQDSEAAYVFVKVEKSANPDFDTYMTYEMATGWTLLDGTTDVYYRTATAGQSFDVLKDNQVKVKDSVTKAQMDALTANPTLTVTAYASQLQKDANTQFTAAEAWANIA